MAFLKVPVLFKCAGSLWFGLDNCAACNECIDYFLLDVKEILKKVLRGRMAVKVFFSVITADSFAQSKKSD